MMVRLEIVQMLDSRPRQTKETFKVVDGEFHSLVAHN